MNPLVKSQARRHMLARVCSVIAAPTAVGLATVVAGLRPDLSSAAAAAGPVLVLGDSLSAEYGLARGTGWVALLKARLAERHVARELVNASISGETTAGGVTRLGALLERHHPSVVVVELGGNDALRGLDLASTRANLISIVRASRAAGAGVLLLGMRMPPNYGRTYGERFAAIYSEVAHAEGAQLVPFFLEGVAQHPQWFQEDRIHPTGEAQATLLDNVWPALSRLMHVKP
jgi:acyl-CoA thioesterase-1